MVCAVICVAVGAIIDFRSRRIPNWLTLPAVIVGLVLHSALLGLNGTVESLLGTLSGFFLLFFFYAVGGMGAGDVKLLAAVGSFLGPKLVFCAFIWMCLSGGCLAVIVVSYKRAFAQTIRNLKLLAFGWLTGSQESISSMSLKNPSLHKIPYGIPIAVGTVLAIWLQRLPGLDFQGGTPRVFLWNL